MARPIEATPILYGEAAQLFLRRMNEVRKEKPQERERRLRHYYEVLEMMERGKDVTLPNREECEMIRQSCS